MNKNSQEWTAESSARITKLEREANDFLREIAGYRDYLENVYQGRVKLVATVLPQCYDMIMGIHQGKDCIDRLVREMYSLIPKSEGLNAKELDGWPKRAVVIEGSAREACSAGRFFASSISKWASLRVDGTVYPDVDVWISPELRTDPLSELDELIEASKR